MHYTLKGKITKGFSYQIDKTLTIEGVAGDAKATGDAIAAIRQTFEETVNTHVNNKENPHGVTAEQIGARPSDWMPTAEELGATPASHAENKNNPHGVTAAQVGARPNTWMPTASEVGARPSNWTPTAADVGAVTEAQVSTMINEALGVIENGTY